MDQHLACSWNPSQWCSCHNTVGADPALVALQFFRPSFRCSFSIPLFIQLHQEEHALRRKFSKFQLIFQKFGLLSWKANRILLLWWLNNLKVPPLALLGQWIFQVLHIGHCFLCADEMRHRQPCGDGIIGHRDHGVVVQRQTDRSLTQQDVPIVDDHLQTVSVGEVTTNASYFWMFLIFFNHVIWAV